MFLGLLMALVARTANGAGAPPPPAGDARIIAGGDTRITSTADPRIIA